MDKRRSIIVLIFIILFIIAIVASILYYKGKYSVSFETGTNEVFLTKYVEENGKVKIPIEPTKEGYVFKEWQLNGETYDFNTKISSDTVLTAKWVKEEYVTIKFNTNSDVKIKPLKMLKGDIIDNLPVSIKENYEFIGWYLNDKLYANEEIYDDIILNAEYKNDKINSTYKIGDIVSIVGEYSDSANSINDYNKKAIGWQREILGIINDSEFPYVVGNYNGVTGFFKADSIQIVK